MSKTVSYTNVHLSYTADLQGLRQAKSDMAAMNRVTKQAQTDTQKYEEHVVKLNRLLHNGKISQEQYNQALAAAKTRFQNAEKAAAGYANTLKGIAGIAGSAGLGAGAGGLGLIASGGPLAAAGLTAAGATYAAMSSTKAFMDLRSTLVRLEVILGDAKRANDMFQEMRALAAVSPLETKDFTDAAAFLLQNSVAAEELMGTLRRLSDVSAGNSEVFSRMAYAYGQVMNMSRLTGQENRQLINAGFNPLSEISRTTGESMENLAKRMEAGAISAREVADAFKSATEAGGRFYQMNERMGEELSAKVAQLRDEWTKLKETVGETLAEPAGGLLGFIRTRIQEFQVGVQTLQPSELMRAFNRGGGDREFVFRAQGRIQGMKSGFMDPLTQKEMSNAEREHKALVAELEKKTASDSIKFFTVTAKAISDGVVGQMDGAMKSAAEINKQVQQAADAMREHSTDIVRNDIKRRAGALEDIKKLEKQLLELKPMQGDIRTDLPAAVEYGTREAYRVITDAQKMADDAHLKKLEEQRVLQQKQNDILMEIRDKQKVMGIVK